MERRGGGGNWPLPSTFPPSPPTFLPPSPSGLQDHNCGWLPKKIPALHTALSSCWSSRVTWLDFEVRRQARLNTIVLLLFVFVKVFWRHPYYADHTSMRLRNCKTKLKASLFLLLSLLFQSHKERQALCEAIGYKFAKTTDNIKPGFTTLYFICERFLNPGVIALYFMFVRLQV